MPHNIGMQTYSFSNGKYRVSFLAAKNSIVESRHAGDIIRTIAEMKDFLSTTSYQQSTERIYNSPDRCNYAVFTGNYLSDPYCESTDKKCKYSYIEIHNLIDKEILETYVGR
jgi:hypothetical protein